MNSPTLESIEDAVMAIDTEGRGILKPLAEARAPERGGEARTLRVLIVDDNRKRLRSSGSWWSAGDTPSPWRTTGFGRLLESSRD